VSSQRAFLRRRARSYAGTPTATPDAPDGHREVAPHLRASPALRQDGRRGCPERGRVVTAVKPRNGGPIRDWQDGRFRTPFVVVSAGTWRRGGRNVGLRPRAFLAHLVFAPSFAFVIVDPQFFPEDVAQDLNPKLGAEIGAEQRPTSLGPFGATCALVSAGARPAVWPCGRIRTTSRRGQLRTVRVCGVRAVGGSSRCGCRRGR
jgi:hypothetical protein